MSRCKARASSSRDNPPPPLSQVPLRDWFAKKEHWAAFQNKYLQMPIIKPRYLDEGLLPEDKYPDFWRLLDFQGLRPLLFLKERYYPHLMAAVAVTIKTNDTLDNDGNGEFQLEFRLAGVKHTLGLEEFASVSGLQNEGILFGGGNNPPKGFKYKDGKEAQERLLVLPLSGGKYSVRRMGTDHRLLQYMLTYVWLPRKGNHGVITEEDLIILWAMVTKTKLNWAYLVACRLRLYGFGLVEAGLGHGMLWTKIFEHLGIDLSGEEAIPVGDKNVITMHHLNKMGRGSKVEGNEDEAAVQATQFTPEFMESFTQSMQSLQEVWDDWFRKINRRLNTFETNLAAQAKDIQDLGGRDSRILPSRVTV
ncbi:hypothetical protein PIB30_055336 [Stylosanthes scabra]|uniref:Uncharacterized protein n=1 Tax=Stylosanthes scabra TaxID=79078 RepID=A0ABU6UHU3_9FABA|nr:hypothetical protein [Stylosanthes scabra]